MWDGRPRPSLGFGHFRGGTNVKLEVDAWIAAQRLNRLAQVLPRCLRSFPAQFLDDFTKLLLLALDRDDGDFK
jgi:hypothetical protein